jgi:hypothetical protein
MTFLNLSRGWVALFVGISVFSGTAMGLDRKEVREAKKEI